MATGTTLLLLAVLLQTELSAATTRPIDCGDITSGSTGLYTIYPEKTPGIQVRCDMDTEGGPWTVIQRRVSYSDFYQDWDEYELGFGNLSANFWLGNVQIHAITSQAWYQLRVNMTYTGKNYLAEYKKFAVGDRHSNYQLTVSGYSGNAGNGLKVHNGRSFSAHDEDNDQWSSNCAGSYKGGWWYAACHYVNLNGVYGSRSYGAGINWRPLTGYHASLETVEMKIRRWTPHQNVPVSPVSP